MFSTRRFIDADKEPVSMLPPIIDSKETSVATLDDAKRKIQRYVTNLDSQVDEAKKNSFHGKGGLTADEIAAIQLYTMEPNDPQASVSYQLNTLLRSKDRPVIHCWIPYLNLFLHGLNKLRPFKGIAFRFASGNQVDRYQTECIWWSFSSCTKDQSLLNQILDSSHTWTIFVINCINGKDISSFSRYPDQSEIILLPGTCLRVVEHKKLRNNIDRITLEETTAPKPFFVSLTDQTSTSVNQSQHAQASTTNQGQLFDLPGQTQSYGKHGISQIHPQCQFRTEKFWFDRQFHQNDPTSIKQPHELAKELRHPMQPVNHEILNRIQGSLVGMALGDALGAHVEFRPRDFLVQHPVMDLEGGGTWGLRKGQFTDDTSMALCLAISLICRADFSPYDQLVRYKWWYNDGYMSSTGKCFDIGAATSDSLHEFQSRQKKFAQFHRLPIEQIDYLSDPHLLKEFKVECSRQGVAGNGALMRLAPVPLFFHKHPEYAVQFSGISGTITHGDIKAYDACRYYGALIVAALNGVAKVELLADKFYEYHLSWFGDRDLCPEIMKIAKGSYKRKRGYSDGIRGKGYIVNALEAALWAFWSEETFEKGALAAVNLGDDTDTTAAIYGQLAGAYYGYNQLPDRWVQHVYARDFLLGLSEWLAYEGEKWQPEKSSFINISTSTQVLQQNTSMGSSVTKGSSPNERTSTNATSKSPSPYNSIEERRRFHGPQRSMEQTSKPEYYVKQADVHRLSQDDRNGFQPSTRYRPKNEPSVVSSSQITSAQPQSQGTYLGKSSPASGVRRTFSKFPSFWGRR